MVPNNADTHNSLGVAYYEDGRVELAISETKRAIEIDPEHEKAYMNLGVIYTRIGRLEDALVAFEKAIGINPGYADAFYGLGAIRYIQSEYNQVA